MSGYTGAGKKGIAQYEDKNRDKELDSPRIYALTQQHKHLKEMKAISNLSKEPIFTPIICDYPQGMLVNIPLYTDKMSKKYTKEDIYEMFAEHFDGSDIVKVRPLGYSENMIGSNNFANRDDMEIEINGNDDRIIITSRFDNLGKGASGAAIQCLNNAVTCLKLNFQIFYFQQFSHLRYLHYLFSFGSSASRRPSPNRLKATTVITRNKPGNTEICHASRIYTFAAVRIAPHSGIGGCTPSPM